MAILKADIRTRVNQICKRAETDIDDILLESLKEISLRTGAVTALATGNTVANQAYVSAPTDLAGTQIHSLYLDDASPSQLLTWTQYLHNNISGYALYKDRIYLRPNPTTSDSVYYCEYSKIDDDVDSIELPEIFKPAITRLTASKLYEKYERYQEVENQIVLYNRQLSLLHGERPTPPVAQYNGMEL